MCLEKGIHTFPQKSVDHEKNPWTHFVTFSKPVEAHIPFFFARSLYISLFFNNLINKYK